MSKLRSFFHLITLINLSLICSLFAADFSMDKYKNTHDLINLPPWGPYTKKYIGLSHIPDLDKGMRFDVSVFPGFYRRKVQVPNVFFESDYYPWEASSNLNYFSFRHELEWKDQVYTDISYSKINEQARLIRAECVNNTDINQNVVLHYIASIHFPPLKEYSPYTPIHPAFVHLPQNTKWIDALDYEDLKFAKERPQDNLVYDGKYRGEIRADGFVNGSGIGHSFGRDKGDIVSYKVNIDYGLNNAVLQIRFRLAKHETAHFKLKGMIKKSLSLSGAENDFSIMDITVGQLKKGDFTFSLESEGGEAIELDGFAIGEAENLQGMFFSQIDWQPVPEIMDGPKKKSIILKYQDTDLYYGIVWDYDLSQVRQFFCRDLDSYFKRVANDHVKTVFQGEGKGHFTNIFLRPIILDPHSSKALYGMVCTGTKTEVEEQLKSFEFSESSCQAIYKKARSGKPEFSPIDEGKKYIFSQQKMAATSLCNVVYPVYTQRSFIRHNTPGRWWDCLYTWDSGFIGLGQLELDVNRAIECLNAYVTEPGSQSAFIHHGTPVPVQFYLFLELWNRTQSRELLEYFYPRLRQYHQFMAGHLGSSTTRSQKSNLLKTWDYFYNSGGWDDYPPQKYVHENSLEPNVSPVVNTTHAIRTAKILKLAALELGLKKDVKEYDKDINMFREALQKYSWDEESGYFGYVTHDENGQAKEIMRHESGLNFNMGLGGCYPLVAGVCTPDQEKRLVQHLKSDKEIWTDIGLSAVDQSAPYYRIDGYWNGAVWMAHQWFFWKTMLDMGEADFAFKIAQTALDLWKRETESTYNSFEHFIIETGRGAGWHEFGGLSNPVLNWFHSYFIPGTLTAGLDVWVKEKTLNETKNNLYVKINVLQDGQTNNHTIIACMNPDYTYKVIWNRKDIKFEEPMKGILWITLPGKVEIGELRVEAITR